MTQYRTKNASEILAPIMFTTSFAILVILAALVVIWVEFPRFALVSAGINSESDVVRNNQLLISAAADLGNYLVLVAWALGAIIVVEVLIQYIIQVKKINPDNAFKWKLLTVAQILCPPLRLAAPSLEMDGKVWLPAYGWRRPGRKLFRQVQTRFSRPMLVFALLILPILLIEFGLRSLVEQTDWLRLTLHIATGVIWCAFAVEFIVLLNVSDRKFQFVKNHWVDLAIILLPIIMFLRSLRALQVLRFSRVAKLQQLTNLSRVYRVRGVAMKGLRALMMLEVFGRLMPVSHQKKLERLQRELDEKQEDIAELQKEIDKVRDLLRREEQERAQQAVDIAAQNANAYRSDQSTLGQSSNRPETPLYQDATTSDNVADGDSL